MKRKRRLYPGRIPSELKRLNQWACWKWEETNGRQSKPPYNPTTGNYANCNDPSTWVSFGEALAGYQSNNFDGVSFFLSSGDGLVGIDFDNCRNEKNNRTHEQIRAYLDLLDTYTETSPSGKGVRIFLRGSLPPDHRNKCSEKGVEIYTSAKALTVTGRRHKAYSPKIETRQEELERFYRLVFGLESEKKATRKPLSIEVREPAIHPGRINRLCNRFPNIDIRSMLDGTSHHASPSEAEQALANFAAGDGWSPQEITDLLVHARQLRGQAPKHLGYYQATIVNALESDLAIAHRRNGSSCGFPAPSAAPAPSSPPSSPKKNGASRTKSHKETTLDDVQALYRRHLHVEDDSIIDVILGIAAGNHLPGDPLWLYLIAPPSSGKTEFLHPLKDREDTFFLSDFTPAALISGYVEAETGEDKSLLPKLDGKLVICKDLTAIISKSKEIRNQLYSILRDAYDGHSSRAMGTGFKEFRSRFNLIAAVTPQVEKTWTDNSPLGERFLSYRLRIENRSAHVRKGMAHNGEEFRQRIREAVWSLLDRMPNRIPDFPSSLEEPTENLAAILAHFRTVVDRDGNEVLYEPTPEIPTRIVKQLRRLGQSLALIRGKDSVTASEFAVMRKVAFDSIPSRRKQLLDCLWQHKNAYLTTGEIAEMLSLAETTAGRLVSDFKELRTLDQKRVRQGKRPSIGYRLNRETRSWLSAAFSVRSKLSP